ncbi:hypothetical protein N7495_009606 [Penicillium taxi]|uniref:uncharacterized protein n=1 Tax=Penicillium taxi TaxID=168475 RepID=UPI0025455005|nr:uncharacterized protein N7495_009606 [Penicillium taxi]KAJ5885096.1 hypothetical protein N7495_009606 [Penicillium taxi]
MANASLTPFFYAVFYMRPSDAIGIYLKYITPFSGRAKLISPPVASSTNAGEGLSWFGEFISGCSSCGIAGFTVHYADELTLFVTEAVAAAAQYGLTEVQLTELALYADINGIADVSVTQTFLANVIPFLGSTDGLTRYAYFMCAENYILTNGALNSVGSAYLS